MTTDNRGETPATHSDPTTDPAGTVRVHPDDGPDDPTARRVIKTSSGRWSALTHPASTTPESPEMLRDWPRQPLTHLALALNHSDTTTSPRTRPRPTRVEHVLARHRVAHRPRNIPPRPTTPTFWEEAKAYCRAFLRTDDRLKEYERSRTPPDASRGHDPDS